MATPIGWGNRQATMTEDEILYKVDRRGKTTNNGDDDDDTTSIAEDDRRNDVARNMYEKNDGAAGKTVNSLPIGWGVRQSAEIAAASKAVDTQAATAPPAPAAGATPFGSGRHAQAPMDTSAMNGLQISMGPSAGAKRRRALAFPTSSTPKMMDAAVYAFALQHAKDEVADVQLEIADIDAEMRRLAQRKQQAVVKWQQKTVEMQTLETRVKAVISGNK